MASEFCEQTNRWLILNFYIKMVSVMDEFKAIYASNRLGASSNSLTLQACFGVVKAIDEAIRILTCLRKVESKKPESDISPVEVPKEFICTLSNTIMIEPDHCFWADL